MPECGDGSTAGRETLDRPRILILRPDHLGDLLLTLPAVALLRQALPHAFIAAIAPPASAEMLRYVPDLDAWSSAAFPPVTAPDDPPGWAVEWRRAGAALRGRFDLALIPRIDDPWSGALAEAAEIPVRIGFDHLRTRRFLTHAVPPSQTHASSLAIMLAAEALTHLGMSYETTTAVEAARLVLPPSAEREAADLLASVSGTASQQPIVLQPGAGWALKSWPAQRWGALARRVAAQYGVQPLISGSPSESELAESIVAESEGSAYSIAGRLSIGGLAALFCHARVVVGVDSGALHLAAAVGTPVVGLFGPADPAVFQPLLPPHRCQILYAELPCRPCGTLVNPPCGATAQPRCMTKIGVDDVLAAIDVVLRSTRDVLAYGELSQPMPPIA